MIYIFVIFFIHLFKVLSSLILTDLPPGYSQSEDGGAGIKS
jgi:hypothetical protein